LKLFDLSWGEIERVEGRKGWSPETLERGKKQRESANYLFYGIFQRVEKQKQENLI
jgi:hypothetical protein